MKEIRRTTAFAQKYANDLPRPEQVLEKEVPQKLNQLFTDARLAIDRYRHALADAVAEEKNIESIGRPTYERTARS